MTATAQNQISGDSYDAAGNLTAVPGGGSYAYNAENQLTSAAGVNYLYDPAGSRVEKSSGTLYWYGPDNNVLEETTLTWSPANEYVFLGGQRIARIDSSGNVFYYFTDHLGTSRVIAEVPSGSTTATPCYDADFYPFGGERAYTNTCAQNYKFTGKERDSESNLDNFGARYDSSSMGRFMSPDPLGDFVADATNPQSWNLYSYVRNSPLSFIDPYGLDCVYMSDMAADGCVDSGGYEYGLLDGYGYGNAPQYPCGPNCQMGFTIVTKITVNGNEGCNPATDFACGELYGEILAGRGGSGGGACHYVLLNPCSGVPTPPQSPTPAQAATNYCQQHGQLSFNIPFTHIPVTISLSATAFVSFSATNDVSLTFPPSAGVSVDITVDAPTVPNVPVQFGVGKNASVGTFLTSHGPSGFSLSIPPFVPTAGSPVTISPNVGNVCGQHAGGG